MKISNGGEYKAFKKDLKKLLKQVKRCDLRHYQDDIRAYWCDESVETKTITECLGVLVALYPTKKVYERKYHPDSQIYRNL
jgi:hypothetical protein